ncbi:DUF5655 domain-containing protein [Microbacterium rhizomatis]|uniref:DUF5655 domain-containing protein n=1 Tax=Microbacterium rhizomatis TaxID=1631477 RepID=A0A5J5J3F0_9MICO|nr:DUF5655 domain-containing protein [Microbacterium rhizomatis]KAA9107953.1 hypothetical protein F6B43_11045 [Microbacterium rhizomatis]
MTDAADEEWTVERHLAGQPDFAVDLYHRFIRLVEEAGPFTYAVHKTTITLKGARRGFAGARPDRSGLRGYFDLQREIHDPRITSVAPYTKRLFVHHFRVSSAEELDDEFAGWLREAYEVGDGAHMR